MRDILWNAIMRIGAVSGIGAISLLANAESVERGPTFSPATDWALVTEDQLGELGAERQLGRYFVVKQSEALKGNVSVQAAKQGLTLMEAGPGVFAISDASAIVITDNKRQLDDLILDYNLAARHMFASMPAAVIQFTSIEGAERALSMLRGDVRVRIAELNLQTFADRPQ